MAQPALSASPPLLPAGLKQPLNFASQAFADHKWQIYEWLREEAPLYQGRISFLKVHVLSRFDDAVEVLRDPRFVRNRSTATGGGSRLPFPMPPSLARLANSMIIADDPEHQRLRGLVNSAFKPGAIGRVQHRVESLTHELLDELERESGPVDLLQRFAKPIPTTVIRELVGVADEDMLGFTSLMDTLGDGLTGWNVLRAIVFDLPKSTRFVRELVARKRRDPQDDILSGLIHAEEDGDRLSEDEIVSMVFLLVVAGFETTQHLISNGIGALLTHRDQLERLQADPALIEPAIEEMLRYCGPIHGTKMNFATEDVEWHGVTIKRGEQVVPSFGAANRDPRAFEAPERFDIGREPNRHLAFGYGRHFCLGAQLARMETRTAIAALVERFPKMQLAVAPDALELQAMPFWHRHRAMPVRLR